MNQDLYKIGQEILKEMKTAFTKDIEFVGTMTVDEDTPTGKITTKKDIFVMIDKMPDGSTVKKFYDGNKTYIAGCDKDGKIYPSFEFAYEDLSFFAELEHLSQTQGISLNELDNNLEKISKILGIKKEDIESMSEVDLEQAINEKNEPRLTLNDEEKNSDEAIAQNQVALNNISSKQELDLDQKVDDKHTLGEILGAPAGSKLIAVHTKAIPNNPNSTRFSCVIEEPNGKIYLPETLNQVGGITSDKTVYETTRDGSKIEKKSVESSFAIDSSIVDNGIITLRYGSMGYIDVSYGQTDPTSHRDAFTQELETVHTYYPNYTSPEVLEEFNPEEGTYNITGNLEEIRKHEEYGSHSLSIDEADGNLSTGHIHEKALEEIIAYDSNILHIFTIREIEDRLQKMTEKYPEDSFEDVVNRTKIDLSKDASRLR